MYFSIYFWGDVVDIEPLDSRSCEIIPVFPHNHFDVVTNSKVVVKDVVGHGWNHHSVIVMNNSVVNPWVTGFKSSYTSPIAGSIYIFRNSRVSFSKKFGEIVNPQEVGSRPNLSVWGTIAIYGEFDRKIQIKKTKIPISIFFI
jgi:hypothetical protein